MLGYVAQGAFFMRFFIQWLASEKEKKSVVPTAFWYASLVGGLLLLSYSVHTRDPVFILGQAVGAIIYIRNVALIRRREEKGFGAASWVLAGGVALLVLSLVLPGVAKESKVHATGVWLAFGLAGQVIFFMRFVVQWIVSEREKRSVMPKSFWYISLCGGVMLLAYAVKVRDPVFIVGQGTGVFIYLRNIILIEGERGRDFAYTVLLALAGTLLFVVGTGDTALSASSEARSAEIAREMYVTGDYIVPHLNGMIALTKPPLYHWLAAASYAVFGVNEFAARFPSGLAGIGAILATFLLVRRLYDSTTGFLAAVMTASAIEFVWNARAARTDMVYTFFVVAAITVFVYASGAKRAGKGLYVTAFALMGLAFLAKGPAGFFLPVVAGGAYVWLSLGKGGLRSVPWGWGRGVVSCSYAAVARRGAIGG